MLKSDPQKAREWQQRSQQAALQRRKDAAGSTNTLKRSTSSQIKRQPVKSKGPRYNDAPWRAEVMELHGERCKSCGDVTHVQADHVIPKSQDGTARHDVLNGLPLCGEFSRATRGGCHPAKTAGTLKFDAGWFLPEQLDYLASKNWVAWDDQGEPYGRGHKHFLPRSQSTTNEGGHHGQGSIHCW